MNMTSRILREIKAVPGVLIAFILLIGMAVTACFVLVGGLIVIPLLLLSGVGVLALMLQYFKNRWEKLLKNGLRADGSIIEKSTVMQSDGPCIQVSYRFISNGRQFENRVRSPSSVERCAGWGYDHHPLSSQKPL
jgi:hypothetical protein